MDATACGGIAKITFDPFFDRVPSTKEFVDTFEKARQYSFEVFGKDCFNQQSTLFH